VTDAAFELSADGQLITITPTGSETGARYSWLVIRLLSWADQADGWKAFYSFVGLRLSDGSVFSPDASLPHLVVELAAGAAVEQIAPAACAPCWT
jgi:Uma2 family endonuclease